MSSKDSRLLECMITFDEKRSNDLSATKDDECWPECEKMPVSSVYKDVCERIRSDFFFGTEIYFSGEFIRLGFRFACTYSSLRAYCFY